MSQEDKNKYATWIRKCGLWIGQQMVNDDLDDRITNLENNAKEYEIKILIGDDSSSSNQLQGRNNPYYLKNAVIVKAAHLITTRNFATVTASISVRHSPLNIYGVNFPGQVIMNGNSLLTMNSNMAIKQSAKDWDNFLIPADSVIRAYNTINTDTRVLELTLEVTEDLDYVHE